MTVAAIALYLPFSSLLIAGLIVIPILLITIYFRKIDSSLFGTSLFFLLVYLSRFLPFTVLSLFYFIPLTIYLLIVTLIKPFRPQIRWLKIGHIDKSIVMLGVFTVVVSCLTLWLWTVIAKPDLADITKLIPNAGLWSLTLLGLAFAVINSIVEEIIYRGVLWNVFSQFFKSIVVVLILQAVFFGISHLYGFPRGLVGIILASLYGVLQGLVRYRSQGFLAPVLTHILADVTIFVILLGLSGKI
jgi:uncharacterized protein